MSFPRPPALTLNELLRWRAAHQPNDCAYTFLSDGESKEINWSHAELDRHARAVAAALQQHAPREDRALLLYPAGLEYIGAFFGSLYAGVAAVPAYPPQYYQSISRILAIIQDARPRFALTTSAILESVKAVADKHPELRAIHWVATDALPAGLEAQWKEPSVSGDTLAFLQYTSGSTSTPKGVMVLHRNLLTNEEMIQRAFGNGERTVVVGWLPLYHDMGLIGNVLQPLYLGTRAVLMSPWSFLQRPARWLWAITKYRATTSGGPNFAYALCVKKVKPEQRERMELSSWQVAYNGAEPVRAETLELFARTFASAGFRREAFYPCYGLAESTLFVTGGVASEPYRTLAVEASSLERNRPLPVPEGSPSSRVLVGCGRHWGEGEVRIVDPESCQACAPGEVGEIWVAGPHVTHGYWGREETNAATFQARLAGSEAEGPFLRTGDLGFFHEGELYVTGRLKDLIIIDGRNHYPQDIELTVEGLHESFRQGCAVAFSVDQEGEERLVVMVEVERRYRPPGSGSESVLDPQEAVKKIRQELGAAHSVEVHDVVLLRHGEVLKTSSGKVQRRACRALYLEGSLQRWPG